MSPMPQPPAPPLEERRTARTLLTICCGAYLASVLAGWLLLLWADQWWLATVWMFAPRWLLALPLVVLIPAALLWRRRALIALALAALLVAGPVMGFSIPWPTLLHSAPAGPHLRVLTCNMHYSHDDPPALEELIAATAPDVVALQEWQGSERSALRKAPGWHVHPGTRLFLASRHPIRAATALGHDSMGEHASAMRYELETPLGDVHLLSVHLATARFGIADTIHDNSLGPAEVSANTARRLEQSAFVYEEALHLKGPLLIVGDFNTPPESAIVSEIWRPYTDAFSAAGWGWGYTFFGSRTMVRIDHVFAGRGWFPSRCTVGPPVGSLHRPVIADLVWTDPVSGAS
jgi:vancomycin resistance protein VanJ